MKIIKRENRKITKKKKQPLIRSSRQSEMEKTTRLLNSKALKSKQKILANVTLPRLECYVKELSQNCKELPVDKKKVTIEVNLKS